MFLGKNPKIPCSSCFEVMSMILSYFILITILFICMHAFVSVKGKNENSWVLFEWISRTPPYNFSHENNLPTVKILSLRMVLSQRVARYILIRQITRVEAIYYKYTFCYLRNNFNNANKNTLSNISQMIHINPLYELNKSNNWQIIHLKPICYDLNQSNHN